MIVSSIDQSGTFTFGSTLSDVAERLGATPMQVALAWLLRRAPNILLIPGTSSVMHLRENLAAAELNLPDDALIELDGVASIGGLTLAIGQGA